jgi:hypothetical protein
MGTNTWGFYNGSDVSYGSAASSGWAIYLWRVNGTGYNSYDLSAQGLQLRNTTSGGSIGGSTTRLGSNETAPTQLLDGDMTAYGIASSALTDAACQQTLRYLRDVYLT